MYIIQYNPLILCLVFTSARYVLHHQHKVRTPPSAHHGHHRTTAASSPALPRLPIPSPSASANSISIQPAHITRRNSPISSIPQTSTSPPPLAPSTTDLHLT